jgi:hypothetical protein
VLKKAMASPLGAGAGEGGKGQPCEVGGGGSQQSAACKRRGPSRPPEPAKSLPIATKNFYKGVRCVAQELGSLTAKATLPCDVRGGEGPPQCAVGVLMMAVAQGLTDCKNGRLSREDEKAAASRKPQAFMLTNGRIPPTSLHKIFQCAIEGGCSRGSSREGSPPAEITSWLSCKEADQWFDAKHAQMLLSMAAGAGKSSEKVAEESLKSQEEASGAGEAGDETGGAGGKEQAGERGELSEEGSSRPPAPPPAQAGEAQAPFVHPIMSGLISAEEETRARVAAQDIGRWLRKECGSGLDAVDMQRVRG